MRIKDILNISENTQIKNIDISEIADDSRCLPEECLFFVLRRANFNIFSVLEKTEKKVAAYVADIKDKAQVEKKIKNKPIIYVQKIEEVFYAAVKRYYNPVKKIKIIGITGTNGKTSTAYFLYQLLKKQNEKVALFGTTGYFFNSSCYKVNLTTADFLTLHKLIKKASQAGVNYLILEVSSHAIAQERIKGIDFSICVFTNLSRDHLDYHKTMQNYFQTKKSFFLQNKSSYSILNNDCRYGRKILTSLDKKISYGIKNKSDYWAQEVRLSKKGSIFVLTWQGNNLPVSIKVPGYYNILNFLAALASAVYLGFKVESLVKSAASLKSPIGRFQEISEDIFVDYAHTPEGLKFILSSLREIGYAKIISVFGCGGQRDKGKRKLMGKVSSQLAEFTFITSDNPRSEDPASICDQIKKGFDNDKHKVVFKRREAIAEAISLHRKIRKNSKEKVCLVVAGKGHENYQILKQGKIEFKDSKVIKNILKNEN